MNPIDYIVSYCNSISSFFYSIYLEVIGWVYPFWYAATFFYSLSTLFSNLAWSFYYFSQWVNSVDWDIGNILSWDTIWSKIKDSIPNWDKIGSWFEGWWDDILTHLTTWWSDTSLTVQGWIALATEGLDTLKVAWSDFWNITFPEWTGKLDILRGEWDNFWTATFPTLIDASWITTWWNSRLKDIQDLINTALRDWTPLLESWQDWKDSIIEFIQDPWQFLYDRLEDLFDRFW